MVIVVDSISFQLSITQLPISAALVEQVGLGAGAQAVEPQNVREQEAVKGFDELELIRRQVDAGLDQFAADRLLAVHREYRKVRGFEEHLAGYHAEAGGLLAGADITRFLIEDDCD